MTPTFNRSVTSVTTTHWRVEIEHIGEGMKGDYNANDEKDVPLLRFRILARAKKRLPFVEVDNNSYCTLLDWRTVEKDAVMRARVLLHILNRINDLDISARLKPITEDLSWMDINTYIKEMDDDRAYIINSVAITPASVLMNRTTKAAQAMKDLPALGIPAPPKIKVLVMVSGGMVTQVQASSENVDVEILDWDNLREGDTFHDLGTGEGKAIDALVAKNWPHVVG